MPPAHGTGALQKAVTALMAKACGVSGVIDPAERFANYGMTSRIAAGFVAELSEHLGRPLPRTLIWDHPTIERLVEYLTGKTTERGSERMRPMASDEQIAILGMACRFPQAPSPEAFWDLLCAGQEAVTPVPRARWDAEALYNADPDFPGTVATRRGGFLADIAGFDAAFFGIAPREALEIDPQQRIALELAYAALDRAGIAPGTLSGSRTGVFMGAMWSEYATLFPSVETMNQHSATGRDIGVIANRISYALGALGPSMTVDTACSASLVAVHLAARSLRSGESRLALAGGVNLMVSSDSTVAMSKFGAMAPDGRSKAFDASADGYVRGEGAGVVVLAPLSEALRRGLLPLALLEGSAVNNDGPSNGLTAPNPDAQVSVMQDALSDAGLAPEQIAYVEAHGTGTQLGDPIEARSIGKVYGQAPGRAAPLPMGSVKTNIGHLEAAAGVAGLIKSTLILSQGTIPATLHYSSGNPHIDFAGLNLQVPATAQPLVPSDAEGARIGVSSFGFGGTNAHAIVKAAPQRPRTQPSAARAGRPVAFVYTGNGGNWEGMGRDLLLDPAFRAGLFPLNGPIAALAGFDIFDALAGGIIPDTVPDTTRAQLFTFAIQAGLTRVLEHRGQAPVAVMGHSLGEISALYAARHISAREAISVVYHRSRLQADVAGQGAMALLRMPWDEAEPALAAHPELVISGANDARSVTLSGPRAAIDAALEAFTAQGASILPIDVDIAYHSPAMDPAAAALSEAVDGITAMPGRAEVFSTVTGARLRAEAIGPAYFARNLREPVRFADAFCALSQAHPDAIFIEIGPHPLLVNGMSLDLAQRHETGLALPSLSRGARGDEAMAALCDHLDRLGVAVAPRLARDTHVLALSAKSDNALRAMARDLLALDNVEAGDLCHALFRRDVHKVRFAATVSSAATLRETLAAVANGVPLGAKAGEALRLSMGGGLPNLTGLDAWRRADPAVDHIAKGVEAAFATALTDDAPATENTGAAAGQFVVQVLQHWGIQAEIDSQGAKAAPEPAQTGAGTCITYRDTPLSDAPLFDALSDLAARIWMDGGKVDWLAYGASDPRPPVALPSYPFQHQRFWPKAQLGADWVYALRDVPVPVLGQSGQTPASVLAALSEPGTHAADPSGLDAMAAHFARRALQEVARPDTLTPMQARQWQALHRLAKRAEAWPIAEDLAHFPDEAALITRIGNALPGILRGEVDPLTLLFSGKGPDLLANLYSQAPFARQVGAWSEETFAALLDDGARNIIEIGAGTGATASRLVPHLPSSGRYAFTDVSNSFLTAAEARFAGHPGFEVARFDVEQTPEGALAQGAFDAALAVNVVHATKDIGAALRHIRQTLRPGGYLVLGEITGTPGWLDLVFGTLDGWWRFDDAHRTQSATLTEAQWEQVLKQAGFDTVAARPDGDRQSLILARAAPASTQVLFGESLLRWSHAEGAASENWIVTDATRMTEACQAVDDAKSAATPVRLVTIGDGSETQALIEAYAQSTLGGDQTHYRGRVTLEEAHDSNWIPGLPLGEDHLRLTGGIATASRLARIDPVEPAPLIDPDAAYVITGGLGTVGFAFARHLVTGGARHVVLTSRSASADAEAERLEELRNLGALVQVARADVTDRPKIREVLGGISRPIAAIIHAAGTLDKDLSKTLPPKLDGARILVEEGARRGVGLTLLASSAAGTWGAPGMAAYAAANAAMDAFARTQHALGRPIVSIGFGRFEETGLLDADTDAQLAAIGMRAMPIDSAVEIAWRLAAADTPHFVVADIDWSEFGPAVGGTSRKFFSEVLTGPAPPPVPIASASAAAPKDTAELIRELLAQSLGYADPADVPADQGFFELGLDSLGAVKLRQRLKDALGREIPAAMLFSHPTLTRLIEALDGAQSPAAPALARGAANAPIAILGIGCRFPGGVHDFNSMAEAVFAGQDTVAEVPARRWDWRSVAASGDETAQATRWGSFLDDVDLFDAGFFRIPPTDAAYMDPQQRLLLEVAWHTLEHGGFDPAALSGSKTGVFVGMTGSDYAEMARALGPERLAAQAIMGLPANTAAGRISHTLGLEGPALTLDTACSSSLAAVHQACQALRSGGCSMALAGGVNLILSPKTSVVLARAGMLSPTGRCRTFDAGADGFVRAEGCGMVLLKPLEQAEADGDPILAVLRGSAMNHDGRASGLTVPNGSAQEQVIGAALQDAQRAPADIAYVELHGTGTPLGDPVEASALQAVFGNERDVPLMVSSLKSCIGHAESAAGIGGLIRAVAALRDRAVPPGLHFDQLNPLIPLDTTAIQVPCKRTLFGADVACAGVSAFGASGTNVHVVLEEHTPVGIERAPRAPTAFQRKRHWIEGVGAPAPVSVEQLTYHIEFTRVQAPKAVPDGPWRIVGAAPRAEQLGRALSAYGLSVLPDGATPDIETQTLLIAEPSLTPERLRAIADETSGPLCVMLEGGFQVAASEVRDINATGLCALGRALALSHPQTWLGVIDVPALDRIDPTRLASALQLLATTDEVEVALRDTSLWVPRMARVSVPERVLSIDKSVLIAGAFGTLGAGFVRHLFAQGARSFVLVSRHPKPELFADLVAAGAQILCCAADIADEAALQDLAQGLDPDHPIGLILHLAGQRDGSFTALAAAKRDGARVLQRLANRWPKAPLVLFGSGAAAWGDPNLPAYAAANGALHGIADAHRAKGHRAAVVELGPVEGTGMLDDDAARAFARAGVRALGKPQAIEAALRFAANGADGIVADIDWPAFHSAQESKRPRPFLSRFAPKPQPSETPVTLDRDALTQKLRALVGTLLGVDDPTNIDADTGFVTLGMDSFGIMELRKAAAEIIGRAIPAAILFEAPTIHNLADALAGGASRQPAQAPSVVTQSKAPSGAIAVIGCGLRLPGDLKDLQSLHAFLAAKRTAIGTVPSSRNPATAPQGAFAKIGGWLDQVDAFDADLFGISPREAIQIDPQHRLLLQLAWETIQNSGRAPQRLAGSNTGVFVGITGQEYADVLRVAEALDAHSVGGRYLNAAAGRVSHAFGLTGPSMAVDTACSSSATAVHLAAQALLDGQCDLALAGGVNLVLADETSDVLASAQMLSPDHRCRSFDAAANGYVRAEGLGLVMLKRLEEAQEDGDNILLTILSSAMNHDGASGGFTVPNGEAQRAVIRKALRQANVAPRVVSYVEAHGTGTRLGDPIEFHALSDVYRDEARPLAVGSLKANIGHTEATAGVAGLLKLVAAAQTGQIPGHPTFAQLNPEILVPPDHVRVLETTEEWQAIESRRLAGLSAFGASGTNVHMIVEAPPSSVRGPAQDGPTLLIASAARPEDVPEVAQRLSEGADLHAASRIAALSYGAMPYRVFCVADDADTARAALTKQDPKRAGTPRVGFIFTGQGAQIPGMGQRLYAEQPVFRSTIDEIAAHMDDRLPVSLAALVTDPSVSLDDTAMAQPALFGFGLALATLWQSWGVTPKAVLGHSLGEITAAALAGMIDTKAAARFVIERGRLMSATQPGAMAALLCQADIARGLLPDTVSVAALNGPENTVVSGPVDTVEAVIRTCDAQSVPTRRLPVTQAFHSGLMEPALPGLRQAAEALGGGAGQVPLFSNLDGMPRTTQSAEDWVRHVRAPVAFADGLEQMAASGCDMVVEIGPRPILTAMGRSAQPDLRFVPGYDIAQHDRCMLQAAGELWQAGAGVDLARVLDARPKDAAIAPPYPMRPVRHWPETRKAPTIEAHAPKPLFAQAFKSPAFAGSLARETFEPEDWPELSQSDGFAHVGTHLALWTAGQPLGALAVIDAVFLQPLSFTAPNALQRLVQPDGTVQLIRESADGPAETVSEACILSGQPDAPNLARQCTFGTGEEIDPTEFYDALKAQDLPLGSTLKAITRLERQGDAALASLRLLEPDRMACGLPTAAFEMMAQVASALHTGDGTTRLAAGWSRMQRTGQTAREPFTIEALDAGGDLADVRLFSADGVLLVRIEGLRMAPRATRTQRWCGQRTWSPLDASDPLHLPVQVLAFGGDAAALAEKCQSAFPAGKTEDPCLFIFAPNAAEEPAALASLAQKTLALPMGARLILATLGTQAPQGVLNALQDAGGGLWGLARTLGFERPDLSLRIVDLDPAAIDPKTLAQELADAGSETATAWRSGQRYAERLDTLDVNAARPGSMLSTAPPHVMVPASTQNPLAPPDVEIEVSHAALNFRDALVFRGAAAPTKGFGAECLGRITAIGSEVHELCAGQPVVAYVPDGQGAVRDRVKVPAYCVRPAPPQFAIQTASYLLSAMVARQALVDLGQAKPGDTIFVHQATSAVGLAMLSLGRQTGVQVIASAHPDKHPFLRDAGVAHIISSRDGTAEALNGMQPSLAVGAFGPLLAELKRSLAATARLIDLTNTVDTPSEIDLDRLCKENPKHFAALLDQAMSDLAAPLVPLPVDVLPPSEASQALEALANGATVGRKVIALTRDTQPWHSVLITGANGGVGFALAQHLASQGVRRLTLVDQSDLQEDKKAELVRAGLTLSVRRADVSDIAQMRAVLEQSGPHDAVIHAAAQMADGPLAALDETAFATTFRAKVAGARVLDTLTRETGPCQLILLSSVTSTLPSAGQGAYAAANAALDLVAATRRAAGHPVSVQAWGPWDLGIGAQLGARAQKVWAGYGIRALHPAAGLAAFDEMAPLSRDILALDVTWASYAEATDHPPMVSNLSQPKPPALTAPAVHTDLPTCVTQVLRQVLNLPDGTPVDPQKPFAEMGLDSLMSAELSEGLGRALGQRVPTTLAYNHPTVEAVIAFLAPKDDPVLPAYQAEVSSTESGDPLAALEHSLQLAETLLQETK